MRRALFQTAAQTMLLDGRQYETFVILFGTSVDQLILKNFSPGMLYVFVMKQDQRGSHTMNWGTSTRNALPLNPTPQSTTIQCFICISDGTLQSNVPGTWTP